MLKNIPAILSPELLKVLAEMGHSDRICLGDGNFPGARMAKVKNAIFIRADGHGVPARSEWLLVTDKVVVEYLRIVAVTECQRPTTLVEEVVTEDITTALARDYLALAIALLEEAIFDYAIGLLVGHIARSEANATLTIYATTLLVDQRVRASEVAVAYDMARSLIPLGKANYKNLSKVALIEE